MKIRNAIPSQTSPESTDLHPEVREVIVPGGALMDQIAMRVVPINETLWEEQTNSHKHTETDANGHSM